MKISILYDVYEKELMYNEVHMLLKKITTGFDTEIKEFFISKDIPKRSKFDNYSFFRDEQTNSDYYKALDRISYYLNKSDLIIFAFSTYSKKNSIEIKNLLRHLSYKWLPHKNNHNMTNKIAVAMVSSSYFSFKLANLTLSKNLKFWGINKKSIFAKTFFLKPSKTIPIKKIKEANLENSKFAFKIIKQYEKNYPLIKPKAKLVSEEAEINKDMNKKKALIISKCLSNLKKVVHA